MLSELTQIVPELTQHETSVKSIQARILKQSSRGRMRLLNYCQIVLDTPDLSKDQELRVMAAKVLVACLPRSTEVLRRVLRNVHTSGSYDVHFSVFVWLADADHLDGRRRAVAIARDLMGQYLSDVPAFTGHAAWMAGHALGGHFNDARTVRLLANLVTNARYAPGRSAAVSGLAESLRNLDRPATKTFRDHLVSVAKTDRSSRVRAAARLALGKRYHHLRRIG